MRSTREVEDPRLTVQYISLNPEKQVLFVLFHVNFRDFYSSKVKMLSKTLRECGLLFSPKKYSFLKRGRYRDV